MRRFGAKRLACVLTLCAVPAAWADGNVCMPTLEQEIARKFSSIPHIPPHPDEIDLKDPAVVLFDVREASEHEVAHIPGSIRVSPGISGRQFAQRYGDLIKGKRVVFYCAVGYRSSALAARVAHQIKATGATGVANLRGGIFALHNDNRALVDAHGPTPYVHPYNAWWSRYLEQRQLARTSPRPAPVQ